MKGCIFDLDGTLLNTLADIGHACNAVLAGHDFPEHSLKEYRYMVGNGFVTLMRLALPPNLVVKPEVIEELISEARGVYAEHMMDDTTPYPRMPQILADLAGAGCLLAVLSNKPDDMSEVLIKHYFPDIPFKFVQGAKPDVPLKPDPHGLLAMVKAMRLEKKQCFYIGDSNVDMLTARNAHIHSIGVSWGFRNPEELRASGAERIITSPEQLLDLTNPTN